MPLSQRSRLSGQATAKSKPVEVERPPLSNIGGLSTPLVRQASANPRALPPAAVQRLQRSMGNRAVNRTLAQAQPSQRLHSQPLPKRSFAPTAAPVIQRKRELGDIEDEELRNYLGDRSGDDVSKNYDKSLEQGIKFRDKGVKWYLGRHDAEQPIPTHVTEDRVSKTGYKDFWMVDENKITVNTHRGPDVAEETSREIDHYSDLKGFTDDQSYFYSNKFNTVSGKFSASVNYRNLDQEMADEHELPPALSNSEIIWHQHKLAQHVALKKAKDENHDDFKPSRLNAISREEISNEQTLDTIFMTDGGSQAVNNEKVTIEDGTDPDVWALLGTPNGTSSLWLLMQHGREQGATDIESVSYIADEMVIRFMFGED